jgi:hypothetical protein
VATDAGGVPRYHESKASLFGGDMKEVLYKRLKTIGEFGKVCLECANWDVVGIDKLRIGDHVLIKQEDIKCAHAKLGMYRLIRINGGGFDVERTHG